MGQKVAGVVFVKVDGAQIVVTGGAECPISDTTRETIDGAVGYYAEKDRTPYVHVDALHTPDLDLGAIASGTDMTVQVEFNNGKVYVLSGAYLVGEPASAGDDGKISLEFEGNRGIWQ